MRETNRQFEVEYYDTSLRDGTRDVTFELSEDAEDALFSALHREVEENMREGAFPPQKIHLYKRLSEQRTEHPPWIEANGGKRTYDLELSEWDYHLLSKMIGESLSNVLGPDGADRYAELVEVWTEITDQMQPHDGWEQPPEQSTLSSVITEAGRKTIEETAEAMDPESGEFQCLVRDGQFRLYENEHGDSWYVCTDCGTNFAEIGDNHDCEKYR